MKDITASRILRLANGVGPFEDPRVARVPVVVENGIVVEFGHSGFSSAQICKNLDDLRTTVNLTKRPQMKRIQEFNDCLHLQIDAASSPFTPVSSRQLDDLPEQIVAADFLRQPVEIFTAGLV